MLMLQIVNSIERLLDSRHLIGAALQFRWQHLDDNGSFSRRIVRLPDFSHSTSSQTTL